MNYNMMGETPGYDPSQDPWEFLARPWKRRYPFAMPYGSPGAFPSVGLDFGNTEYGGAMTGGNYSYPAGGGGADANMLLKLLPVAAKILAQQALSGNATSTTPQQGTGQVSNLGIPGIVQGETPTGWELLDPQFSQDVAPEGSIWELFDPGVSRQDMSGSDQFNASPYAPGESTGAGADWIGFPAEHGIYGPSVTSTETGGGMSGMGAGGTVGGLLGSTLSGGNPAWGTMGTMAGQAAGYGIANLIPTLGLSGAMNYSPIGWVNQMLGEAGYDKIPGVGGYAQNIISSVPVIGPVISAMLGGIWGNDHPSRGWYAGGQNFSNIQNLGQERVAGLRQAGMSEPQIFDFATQNNLPYIAGLKATGGYKTIGSEYMPTWIPTIAGLYSPQEKSSLDEWVNSNLGGIQTQEGTVPWTYPMAENGPQMSWRQTPEWMGNTAWSPSLKELKQTLAFLNAGAFPASMDILGGANPTVANIAGIDSGGGINEASSASMFGPNYSWSDLAAQAGGGP